jgi:hypothetical protein
MLGTGWERLLGLRGLGFAVRGVGRLASLYVRWAGWAWGSGEAEGQVWSRKLR